MENEDMKNMVSMSVHEFKAKKLMAIENALGELLISVAVVIDDPAAMLTIAGVAHDTYKDFERGFFHQS